MTHPPRLPLHRVVEEKQETPAMAMKSRETKDLPMDVVYEVLLRLPVKTVIRFRSVCKPWNSLISYPPFEQDHYRRRQQNPRFLSLERKGVDLLLASYSNIKDNEEGFNLVKKLSLKFPNTPCFCKIQSCLGLVCIADMESPIFIVNPVSGEHITLPSTEGFNWCIGFGYKASSQEFVVVKFSYTRVENKQYCKVFTLGSEWREAKNPPYSVCHGNAPFLHEAFHLLHQRDGSYTISAFSIEREDYKQILTPKCLTDGPECCQLTELGGAICLIAQLWISGQQQLSLWLLKDYEKEDWVKEYNIDLSSVISFGLGLQMARPLAILGDGGVLLHCFGRSRDFSGWHDWHDLECYHPQNKKCTQKINNCYSGVLYVEGFKSLRR